MSAEMPRTSEDARLQVLEMLVDGAPADAIVMRALSAGLDSGEITDIVNKLSVELQRSKRHREECEDYAVWMAGVHRALQDGPCHVPVLEHIDAAHFYSEYYALNRPVLISRALRDSAGAITFDQLKRKYSGEIVEIMRGRVSGQSDFVNRERWRTQVQFEAFIDEILTVETNELYLTSHNNAITGPLGSIVVDLSPLEHLMKPDNFKDASLWIGPKGAISALHYDRVNVMLVEVLGVKRITLFQPYEECFLYHDEEGFSSPVDPKAPDLRTYPLYRFARPHSVEVHPGSALFIPVGWWHHVESLSPSFSISMSNFLGTHDFPSTLF